MGVLAIIFYFQCIMFLRVIQNTRFLKADNSKILLCFVAVNKCPYMPLSEANKGWVDGNSWMASPSRFCTTFIWSRFAWEYFRLSLSQCAEMSDDIHMCYTRKFDKFQNYQSQFRLKVKTQINKATGYIILTQRISTLEM